MTLVGALQSNAFICAISNKVSFPATLLLQWSKYAACVEQLVILLSAGTPSTAALALLQC